MKDHEMFNMERYQRLKLYDYQNNQGSTSDRPYGQHYNSTMPSGINSEMPYLNHDLAWMVKRFKYEAALNKLGMERVLTL